MKKLLVAAVATFALSGCATLGEGSPIETLAIQYAVLKVTDGDEAKVARVVDIATEAKTLFNTESVTVQLVKSAINARVAKLDLDAADRLLANALVEAVAAELNRRVGDGLISPEKKLRVNAVLDAVIYAATIPVA